MSKWLWLVVPVLAAGVFLSMPGTPGWMIRVPNERDARFLGEWQTPLKSRIKATHFNSDGTGRSYSTFDWGSQDGKLHLRVRSYGAGFFGKTATFQFSENGRLLSLGDKYLGVALRLQRPVKGPMDAIGRITDVDPQNVLDALSERGFPQSGREIKVPHAYAVIGRAACEVINEDIPGAIALRPYTKGPNPFPTYGHARIPGDP